MDRNSAVIEDGDRAETTFIERRNSFTVSSSQNITKKSISSKALTVTIHVNSLAILLDLRFNCGLMLLVITLYKKLIVSQVFLTHPMIKFSTTSGVFRGKEIKDDDFLKWFDRSLNTLVFEKKDFQV